MEILNVTAVFLPPCHTMRVRHILSDRKKVGKSNKIKIFKSIPTYIPKIHHFFFHLKKSFRNKKRYQMTTQWESPMIKG